MWPVVSSIIQFVGYVFAFWGMWKLFDAVVHGFKKPAVGDCSDCRNYERMIANLKTELRRAENKAAYGHKLDRLAEEAIAVGQINIASQEEIEQIFGIGPVKAAEIIRKRDQWDINHRGFPSWTHFTQTENCCRNAIVSWAKQRIGLMPMTSDEIVQARNNSHLSPRGNSSW